MNRASARPLGIGIGLGLSSSPMIRRKIGPTMTFAIRTTPIRTASVRTSLASLALLWAVAVLPREPDAGELRLGQRVYVDDGSCPAGQIKEVAGAKLSAAGVTRVRQCVARSSIRR